MNKDKAWAEFEAKAKKFREERSKAWAEYIDLSSEAGYPIEDTLTNRTLFMGGYESGKEAGAASVDRRAIVKEAFNEVNKWLDVIEEHRTIRLIDYGKTMAAVLADMEANDESV